MISETLGLLISCGIFLLSLILGTFLLLLLRGFLVSLPQLKQNIFTYLDGMFVLVSYVRIFSVSL